MLLHTIVFAARCARVESTASLPDCLDDEPDPSGSAR